jgi:hypothetical protein
MTSLFNPNAKPFYPEAVIRENQMFDALEADFIKRNPWIFQERDSKTSFIDLEVLLEKKFNELLKKLSISDENSKKSLKRKRESDLEIVQNQCDLNCTMCKGV